MIFHFLRCIKTWSSLFPHCWYHSLNRSPYSLSFSRQSQQAEEQNYASANRREFFSPGRQTEVDPGAAALMSTLGLTSEERVEEVEEGEEGEEGEHCTTAQIPGFFKKKKKKKKASNEISGWRMTSGLSSKVWLLQNGSQKEKCSDPEATFTLKLCREQRAETLQQNQRLQMTSSVINCPTQQLFLRFLTRGETDYETKLPLRNEIFLHGTLFEFPTDELFIWSFSQDSGRRFGATQTTFPSARTQKNRRKRAACSCAVKHIL